MRGMCLKLFLKGPDEDKHEHDGNKVVKIEDHVPVVVSSPSLWTAQGLARKQKCADMDSRSQPEKASDKSVQHQHGKKNHHRNLTSSLPVTARAWLHHHAAGAG